jgi:hypothetical protein
VSSYLRNASGEIQHHHQHFLLLLLLLLLLLKQQLHTKEEKLGSFSKTTTTTTRVVILGMIISISIIISSGYGTPADAAPDLHFTHSAIFVYPHLHHRLITLL